MFSNSLSKIERLAGVLAGATMMIVMILVVSDVVMRYAFNKPSPWAYDVITLYLMVALFYLGFPRANAERANVSVDLLAHYFRPRTRHCVEALTSAISLLVFAVICWTVFQNLTKEIATKELLPGYYDFPTFIASLLIVIGAALVCIRSLIQTWLHSLSAIVGRDFCALPGLPGENKE